MLKAILSFITLTASIIDGARILGIFPYEGHSHFVMFEALMKGLAGRGHEVVVLSHFPQKSPVINYTDRSLRGTRPQVVNNMVVSEILTDLDIWGELMFTWKNAGLGLCEQMFQTDILQDLIQNNENFDLLINEQWGTDCFLALAHKLQVPHISVTSMAGNPWVMYRYGQIYNPSYIPSLYLGSKHSGMTFLDRVLNTLMIAALTVGNYIYSEVPTDGIVKKYFGESFPSLREIADNSSLMFTNAHFSVNGARPLVPNWLDIGGIHIKPVQPLPKDLQYFLDNSKNGIILFSLGSMVQSESFDSSKLQDILQVFGSLKQNVLWKFNGNVDNRPENIKLVKWLPQRDVLMHPNVKLFITHGGLMGTQEAILAGVPMIGIPFFGDQHHNIVNYEDMGIALLLEYSNINKERLSSAIKTILYEDRYAEKSKYYSELFKDRPQSALDTAIYWTEYVIRHKGAHHLKSSGTKLYWFQYLLLDVALFIILSVVFVTYACKKIVILIFRVL